MFDVVKDKNEVSEYKARLSRIFLIQMCIVLGSCAWDMFPSTHSVLSLKAVLQLFSTLIWYNRKKRAPDFRSRRPGFRLCFVHSGAYGFQQVTKSVNVSFLFSKMKTFDSFHFPADSEIQWFYVLTKSSILVPILNFAGKIKEFLKRA